MINKLFDIPSFSLFNNYEFINKIKYKVNEIIDAINNTPAPSPSYEVEYSTTERKIGSFFDTDLYEKCYYFTSDDLDDANLYYFDSDISNIISAECISSSKPLITLTNDGDTKIINNASSGSNLRLTQKYFDKDTTENEDACVQILSSGSDLTNITNYLVKLRYTKVIE